MKKIIFSLSAVTLFLLGVFVVIVFNSSPLDNQKSVVPMFFAFEFITILSLSFLISLIALSRKSAKASKKRILKYLRRSAELSVLVVGVSILSAFGVLNILSTVTFALAVILIDLFISNKNSERASDE